MKLQGIGKRLREERERLNLSQEELAAVAGTNRMTPSRYEQGSHSPTLSFLDAIGNAGVDVDYVLTGKRVDMVLSKDDAALLGLAIATVSDILVQHQFEVSDKVRGLLVLEVLRMAEQTPRGSKMKVPSLKLLLSEITS
jgi:transcriptional regulator with XRE-family HTH domain